ncbi:hypothetical protein FEZ18_02080 [Oceanihabitans sp. IOP_32]|uniref:hypothetical protein n=1 Tax=Oceanihabitans sp. IOP_32 TaxID=2529032 RepID=UPI001293EBB3|nr:hypothetical protein [Oceanihabitans sp. IOP_32]QFZ53675.1 hypothetical protein FEZ18_02080 [Oceanihabitans sp. IOP_32]
MKSKLTYKSFNSTKSIEALKYATSLDIVNLENIKIDLDFYKTLLKKSIYKPQVLDLYERLVIFKREIATLDTTCTALLSALQQHANQISNKIECDDVACDNFFIQEHDALELQVFNFKTEIANFKFRFFQYIESVVMN